MALRTFCEAVYKKQPPITSQTKFTQDLIQATGATYEVSDSYAPKLFKREIPLGDEREQFPDPINREGVYIFLKEHLTPPPGQRKRRTLVDRISDIAKVLDTPISEGVDSEAFIWALTDWMNDIIHHPEEERVFNNYYCFRKAGHDPAQSEPSKPRYLGDEIDLVRTVSTPEGTLAFYQHFKHKWVFRNIGQISWEERYLRCDNPKGKGIRPSKSHISIPDTTASSKDFVTIEVEFQARGFEGKATSYWRMCDKDGNDCFPGLRSLFDVEATVMNLNISETEDR